MKNTARGMLASIMAGAAMAGFFGSESSIPNVAEVPPKRKPLKGKQPGRRRVFVLDLDFWNSPAGKAMREWNIAVDRKKLAKQQAKIDAANQGDVGNAVYHRALDRMSILRRHASLY